MKTISLSNTEASNLREAGLTFYPLRDGNLDIAEWLATDQSGQYIRAEKDAFEWVPHEPSTWVWKFAELAKSYKDIPEGTTIEVVQVVNYPFTLTFLHRNKRHDMNWSNICRHVNLTSARKQLVPEGYIKWICINGEYRFGKSDDCTTSHKDLLKDGEIATSAGSVFVFEDTWRVYESGSTTLKIGMHEQDVINLQKLINRIEVQAP